MSLNNNTAADFYNDYSEKQAIKGINERIFFLYRMLRNKGLRSNHSVLELGCGIGAFTSLIARTVKSGSVEAIDLSPVNIDIASKNNRKGIRFVAGDVTQVKFMSCHYHFITLFDVLEHIPMERHHEFFLNISRVMGDSSLFLVNIPNPQLIRYSEKYDKENLQIIDQALDPSYVTKLIEDCGLEAISLESLSIWTAEDYHFYTIRKRADYRLKQVSSERNILQKILHRLFLIYLKAFFRYPKIQ